MNEQKAVCLRMDRLERKIGHFASAIQAKSPMAGSVERALLLLGLVVPDSESDRNC